MEQRDPTHKVVIFNGAPHSGKDTAAGMCKHMFGGQTFKFADPLKNAYAGMFLMTGGKSLSRARDVLEKIKDHDAGWDDGCPLTHRDGLISLSEDWAKKQYGQDIFGKLLAKNIHNYFYDRPRRDALAWVSDGGFESEFNGLCGWLPPEWEIVVVRIKRQGYEFVSEKIKDSRTYFPVPDSHRVRILTNDGTKAELEEGLKELWGWL